jgi:hypothetical protein
MHTIGAVLRELRKAPGELLVRRWNWKSALYSSICRSALFFAVNVGAGLGEAAGAMGAEFVYRAATAGFYGALTQAFRKVEPRWHGAVAATSMLVVVSHTIEFAIHWLRGTPNLAGSIGASVAFTAASTLFNLHAMRQGVLVTGAEGKSLGADLRILPSIVAAIFTRPTATSPLRSES